MVLAEVLLRELLDMELVAVLLDDRRKVRSFRVWIERSFVLRRCGCCNFGLVEVVDDVRDVENVRALPRAVSLVLARVLLAFNSDVFVDEVERILEKVALADAVAIGVLVPRTVRTVRLRLRLRTSLMSS